MIATHQDGRVAEAVTVGPDWVHVRLPAHGGREQTANWHRDMVTLTPKPDEKP